MTGFSQGKFYFDDFSVGIIIKSLNHRYLDITLKGTGITPSSEKLIRGIIKNRIHRGKVEFIFDLFELNNKKWNIQLNENLLGGILDRLEEFKKNHRSDVAINLDPFLKIPMIFHLDYVAERMDEESREQIRESIEKVFDDFIKSRESEGEYIRKDLLDNIKVIESNAKKIEKNKTQIEKEIFEKYRERISRFLTDTEIDDKRIAQEAAILSEKSCINEEINRLSIHCKRLKDLIKNNHVEVKGREADFLSQEMQREVYTISSKTGSMDIHKYILLIRREIEKIKQQVQNVE